VNKDNLNLINNLRITFNNLFIYTDGIILMYVSKIAMGY